MIRQFIRTTIADLAHAVARSELAKENAQLRSTLADKHAALVQANDYSSEVADERDFLRSKLEAAENERDHIRENFASAVKAAERRSPVDRSTAIEEVKKIFSTWWATVGWNMDRMSGRIVDAILGAQKESPAEKPAAFVPAETQKQAPHSLRLAMRDIASDLHLSPIQKGDAIYKLIGDDHARLAAIADEAQSDATDWADELAMVNQELGLEPDAVIDEALAKIRGHAAAVKRVVELEAEVARLSAPCPADGMDDEQVRDYLWQAFLNCTDSGYPSMLVVARSARKLFGRSAK